MDYGFGEEPLVLKRGDVDSRNPLQKRITDRLKEIDDEINTKSREATKLRSRARYHDAEVEKDNVTTEGFSKRYEFDNIQLPNSIPDFISPISKKKKRYLGGKPPQSDSSTFHERKQLQRAIENVEKELKHIVNEQGKLHHQLLTSVDDFRNTETPDYDNSKGGHPVRSPKRQMMEKKEIENRKKRNSIKKQESFLKSLMDTEYPFMLDSEGKSVSNKGFAGEEEIIIDSSVPHQDDSDESMSEEDDRERKNIFPKRNHHKTRKHHQQKKKKKQKEYNSPLDKSRKNYILLAQKYRETAKSTNRKNKKLRNIIQKQQTSLQRKSVALKRKKKETLYLRQQMSIMIQKLSRKYDSKIKNSINTTEKSNKFKLDQLNFQLDQKEKQLNLLKSKLLNFDESSTSPKKDDDVSTKSSYSVYDDRDELLSSHEEFIELLFSKHEDIYNLILSSQQLIKDEISNASDSSSSSSSSEEEQDDSEILTNKDKDKDKTTRKKKSKKRKSVERKIYSNHKRILLFLEDLVKTRGTLEKRKGERRNVRDRDIMSKYSSKIDEMRRKFSRELGSVKEISKTLEFENDTLRKENKILKNDLSEALNLRDVQSERNKDILTDLSSRDDILREFEAKVRKLSGENEGLKMQNAKLKREKNSSNSKLSKYNVSVKNEIVKYRNLMRRAQESLVSVSDESKRLKSLLNEKNGVIEKLREASEAGQKRERLKLGEARSREAQYEHTIAELEKMMDSKSDEIERLEGQLGAAKDSISSARMQLSSKVGEWKDDTVQLQRRNESLISDVNKHKKHVDSLTVQYQILELKSTEAVDTLKQENVKLKSEISKLREACVKEKDSVRKSLSRYENTAEKLRGALAKLKMTSEKGGRAVELLQAKIESLEEINGVLKEKYRMVSSESESRKRELFSVRESAEKTRRKLEEEVRKGVSQATSLGLRVKELEREARDWEGREGQWREEKMILNEKNQTISQKSEVSIQRLRSMHNKAISSLGSQVAGKLRLVQRGMRDLVISTKQEMRRMNSDVMIRGFEKIFEQIQVVRDEVRDREETIDELEDKIVRINEERRMDLESQEKNLKMFTAQIEKLKRDLNQKGEECRLLEQLFINEGRKK